MAINYFSGGLISLLIVLLHNSFKYANASGGDRSWVFNKCLRECLDYQCTQINRWSNHW